MAEDGLARPFCYRYIFTNGNYYEMLGERDAALEIMQDLSVYMGHVFEQICCQYLVRLAKQRQLPFIPAKIGRWWGNNPLTHKQDDIDILALSKDGHKGIFCECKWRNTDFDMKEYEDMLCAASIFVNIEEKHYYIFSKSPFSKNVVVRAQNDKVTLVNIDALFSIC